MVKNGRATSSTTLMKTSSQKLSATKRSGLDAAMRSTSEPRKANIASSVTEAMSETISVATISHFTGFRKKR